MRTEILGVPFDVLTMPEAVNTAMGYLNGDTPRVLLTPNPEFVLLAGKDNAFMQILHNSNMNIADGIGIVYASRLNRVKLPERVAGYDLVQNLFAELAKTQKTVYFLGSKPGVAEEAKARMEARYPGLRVVGCQNGYYKPEQESIIVEQIAKLSPDLLLVGLGAPRQEKFIAANKHRLNARLLIGVGGQLDGMSERVKRAPIIYQKLGLEWFYRLVSEPKRFKRQVFIPIFIVKVLINRLRGRK